MNRATKYTLILGLFAFLFIGCTDSTPEQSGLRFGAPYDDTLPVEPINHIFESKNANGKLLSFQGVVATLCKGNGCWFQLKDQTSEVLVDLKVHNFKLPPEMEGKKVKLNGRVNAQRGRAKVEGISVVVLE